jgi:aerobic carbon-monoxide dehydrogenase large subunit
MPAPPTGSRRHDAHRHDAHHDAHREGGGVKNTFIGSPVERREDLRFVRGRGQYVDDLHPEGLIYAVILRSSVAHGRIRAIDAAAALGIKGVHAVITAKDMPGGPPKIAMRLQPLPEFKPFEQPVIADRHVRYVGEPVAVVLADSVAIGEDALEHIVLDIEPLPPVTDCAAAARGDRLLFEGAGTNRSMTFTAACGDVEKAFAGAAYVRRERFRTQRHYGLTMEPRGVLAQWDPAAGRLTVYGAAKVPFFNRRILAGQIGLPVDAIDMVENDVGGGFGARGEFYPEDFLIPFAARHVGRPVKWIEDRRENLMAMNHAREAEVDVEIACDRDGMILGLRGHADVDMGAYMRTNGAVGARNIAQFMSGPYRIPDIRIDSTLWMTNKTPVGTYRGPGRFETDFFRERLLDMVAADLDLDRVEFRRRNLIPSSSMPHPFPTIVPFESKDEVDSGDYGASLDRCLAEFGWSEKSKLAGQVIDGRHHGFAIGCFLEGGAAGPKETAKLEIGVGGAITVFMGSSAVGQGVETVFAQIAADALELPIERIVDVFHGSTAYVSDGYGAYHSRSIVMGGSALLDAVKNLHDAIRGEAAKRWGCAATDVAVAEDRIAGPGERNATLADFAGLAAEGIFLNKKHTYTYGAHAAHVTVDARTGEVAILDYLTVVDCGRIINPLTVRGQVIGSLVQGLGGAMLENLVYDEEGQLLTGTLADYLLPTASDFPNLRAIVTDDFPSPINPLGAKGAGEGGIIAAGGIMANAVANALAAFGVEPRELPLTPAKIWEMVEAGRK